MKTAGLTPLFKPTDSGSTSVKQSAATHESGWEQTHGDFVLSRGGTPERANLSGGQNCVTCHTAARNEDGTISPSKGAPTTCFSCHQGSADGSPGHPAGWANAASSGFHGKLVKAAGGFKNARSGSLPCGACHTTEKAMDGTVPASPHSKAPACFKCHGSLELSRQPQHGAGWMNPAGADFHGKAVLGAGDYTKAKIGPITCNVCHVGESPTQAGLVAAAPNCHSCHSGGPTGSAGHTAAWIAQGDSNFHGAVVKAAGGYTKARAGTFTCNLCHAGESASGAGISSAAPNCFSCHAGGSDGSPGHPSNWLVMGGASFHGTVVAAAGKDYSKAKAGGLACKTCHAGESPSQTSPVPGAANCFACHAGGPTGSPGHPAGWVVPGDTRFHGTAVKAAGWSYAKANSGALACSICHAGESASQSSPVPGAPTCFACHQAGPRGPHPSGWDGPRDAAFHGTFVAAHGGFQNAKVDGKTCSVCHNTARDAGSPMPGAPNCYQCHAGGPSGSPGHTWDWMIPDGLPQPHGLAANENLGYCARCHNTVAQYQPNPAPKARVDCWSCHDGTKG